MPADGGAQLKTAADQMEYLLPRPRRQAARRHGRSALHRLIQLSFLLIVLGFAASVQAVTLGQARVTSYLNQPLEAEIDLIGVEPGQHEDLRIRIANQDQFDRLDITYTLFLSDLKFDVVQSGGRWLVRVRSRRPVSEPFLDFPVQMTWPGGRMVRQYTLLLDPLTLPRPATVRRAASPSSTPAAAPTNPSSPSVAGATYGPVKPGETLWPIAKKLRPTGITTKQMAIALLRANPQAFIDGNINKLRAGAVLTIPPLGMIQQLDATAASREFAEQTRQWRAAVSTSPRELVPAPVAETTPPPASDATTARPGDEPGEPPTETTAREDDARLRIVSDQSEALTEDDDAIQQQLLVTMEEIESNRITTTAIESRLAKLEEELSKMQALVDLKDRQIAALQSEIAARDEIEAAAAAAEPVLPEALPRTDVIPAVTEGAAPTAAAPVAAPTPPVAVAPVTVEAPPLPAAEPARAPWYDQYLWLIWALLGVIGLTVVGLVIRRLLANRSQSYVPMADLPSAAPPSYAPPARPPAREELKQAEADLRDLSRAPAPVTGPAPTPAEPLPEMDKTQAAAADEQMAGMTSSLLDEILDGSKQLDQRPEPAVPEAVNEKDIAQWVEELGAEIDEFDAATGAKKKAEPSTSPNAALDDDIPSILNELDDQLGSSDATVAVQPVDIDLAPLDEPQQLDALEDQAPGASSVTGNVEDDTFAMSLDLARAYLEIGDDDGARDMLKQALSGARDPEHRRQIEELLQQIG